MSTIFSIKASEAQGRRLDPRFYHPVFRANRLCIETCVHSEVKALCDLSNEMWDKGQCFQDHFPYVEIGAINCENGEVGNIEELSTVDAPSRAQMVVRTSDLLVSATRPTRNAIAFVPTRVEKAIASTGFLVVRSVKSSVVDPRYLFHALRMEFCTKQFDQYSSGGNYPAITKDDFRRIVVPLPPLPEQRKIVAELDAAYAAKRAADEKAAKLLASIDDMVLNELGIAKLPKPDTSLSSRIFIASTSEINNGRFDPKYVAFSRRSAAFRYPAVKLGSLLSEPPVYGAGEAGIERTSEDQPRYVRITDVDENGELIPGFGVTAENVEATYLLHDGDLLLARSGNTVGKSYLHRSTEVGERCIYAGYMIRFRFVDAVLPEYVFAFTQTSYYREWVQAIQRTAGQPNINAEEYRSMAIPLPPLKVQDRIASKASSIRDEARKVKADATAALNAAKRKIEKVLVI